MLMTVKMAVIPMLANSEKLCPNNGYRKIETVTETTKPMPTLTSVSIRDILLDCVTVWFFLDTAKDVRLYKPYQGMSCKCLIVNLLNFRST